MPMHGGSSISVLDYYYEKLRILMDYQNQGGVFFVVSTELIYRYSINIFFCLYLLPYWLEWDNTQEKINTPAECQEKKQQYEKEHKKELQKIETTYQEQMEKIQTIDPKQTIEQQLDFEIIFPPKNNFEAKQLWQRKWGNLYRAIQDCLIQNTSFDSVFEKISTSDDFSKEEQEQIPAIIGAFLNKQLNQQEFIKKIKIYILDQKKEIDELNARTFYNINLKIAHNELEKERQKARKAFIEQLRQAYKLDGVKEEDHPVNKYHKRIHINPTHNKENQKSQPTMPQIEIDIDTLPQQDEKTSSKKQDKKKPFQISLGLGEVFPEMVMQQAKAFQKLQKNLNLKKYQSEQNDDKNFIKIAEIIDEIRKWHSFHDFYTTDGKKLIFTWPNLWRSMLRAKQAEFQTTNPNQKVINYMLQQWHNLHNFYSKGNMASMFTWSKSWRSKLEEQEKFKKIKQNWSIIDFVLEQLGGVSYCTKNKQGVRLFVVDSSQNHDPYAQNQINQGPVKREFELKQLISELLAQIQMSSDPIQISGQNKNDFNTKKDKPKETQIQPQETSQQPKETSKQLQK